MSVMVFVSLLTVSYTYIYIYIYICTYIYIYWKTLRRHKTTFKDSDIFRCLRGSGLK